KAVTFGNSAAAIRAAYRYSILTRSEFTEIRISESFSRLRADELTDRVVIIPERSRIAMNRTEDTHVTRKDLIYPVLQRPAATRGSNRSTTANLRDNISACSAITCNVAKVL